MIFNFFKKKLVFVTIQLNDKIKPIDRGELYEEPIIDLLDAKKYGEFTGGGTMLEKNGEVAFCDISINIYSKNISKAIPEIIQELERLGAPVGSVLSVAGQKDKIEFGKLQGMGVYLDGVGLSDEVYKEGDPLFVVSEINRLANVKGKVIREWTGETETGFYFYGQSFKLMRESILEFVDSYPLCKGAKIVKIA